MGRNGDLGRVEIQQEFIKAAAKQAFGIQLPKVAKAVFDNVTSDITNRAILYLASQAVGMDSSGIHTYTIKGDTETIDGLSFVIRPTDQEIETILREIYGGLQTDISSESSPSALDVPAE